MSSTSPAYAPIQERPRPYRRHLGRLTEERHAAQLFQYGGPTTRLLLRRTKWKVAAAQAAAAAAAIDYAIRVSPPHNDLISSIGCKISGMKDCMSFFFDTLHVNTLASSQVHHLWLLTHEDPPFEMTASSGELSGRIPGIQDAMILICGRFSFLARVDKLNKGG